MGIEDDAHMELASLGRPFQLGMLYDCRSDSLIPGITLWDLEKLKDNRDVRPQPNTQFQIIASDSIEDKSSALNVSGEMKASLLGGMIDVQGSAKYMNNTKKSQQQARVTLQYSTTTRFEQLTMSHLWQQNMSQHHVFDQGTATHVVTAILFGAQAFFVFDREVSSSESLTDVQGQMEAKISFIPKIGFEGKASLKATEEEKASDQNFSCTFYGDYSLPSNPTTFQDAIVIYTSLPQQLGENGDRAVPMKVWLYPLNKLDSSAARLVRGISINLISRSQALLETLNEVDMRCSDMLKELATFPFPKIEQNLKRFRSRCMEHRQGFQKSLARVLPSIRGGGEEEGILADILINKEQSPLGSQSMTEWLDSKQQEMSVVRSYLTQMKDIKSVTQAKIDAEILDLKTQYVICFVFTSLDQEDMYLTEIDNYLQAERTGKAHQAIAADPGHEPWFRSPHSMWECARSFLDLYIANGADKSKKFIVSSVPDKDHIGASIYLYESGRLLTSCFKPPTKPLPPTVCGSSHNSISLNLQPAGPDAGQIVSYIVQYRTATKEAWNTLTIQEIANPCTIPCLCPHKKYQLQYRTVTKSWFSPASDNVIVMTIPTSAPGKPLVTQLKAFEVKVTWEKPTVVGNSVTIHHYKLQYQESRDTSSDQCDPWQHISTKDSKCIFTLLGLKPNVSYTLRVSAVCGQAGESALSNETTFTIHNTPEKQLSKPIENTPKKQPSKAEENISRRQTSKPVETISRRNTTISTENIALRQTAKIISKRLNSQSAENTPKRCVSKPAGNTSVRQASKPPENTPKRKISEPTDNKPNSLAERCRTNCKLLNDTTPSVYQLELQKDESDNQQDFIKCTFGTKSLTSSVKSIMLLGATGSGKTTLINAMVNYILDVEWKDAFRYKLINEETNRSQAESQTLSITAYELNHQEGFRIPYSLTIIDTPGFGDTRGIESDNMIIAQIRNFFTSPNGVDHIDAVCFVIQASLARLTPTQKYIFDSILSIFGKDIADNIRVLVTFADGQVPPVLEAIKKSDIPYPKDVDNQPVNFKFNNSVIFAQKRSPGNCDSDEDNFNKMFWDMGLFSMKKFFDALNVMTSKSLTLTKEVLEERKQLDVSLQGLQPQIKVALSKLSEIHETKIMLQQNEAELEKNKNFEYNVYAIQTVRKPIDRTVSNCERCQFTCHDPCNGWTAFCPSTDWSLNCRNCPGKCKSSTHQLQYLKFDYVNERVTKTYQDLKDKYEKAYGETMTQKKLLQKLELEYVLIQENVLELATGSSRCLSRLTQIALKPNPLSTQDYIDLLIVKEEQDGNPGFQERIKSLREVKGYAVILSKVTNKEKLLPEESNKLERQKKTKDATGYTRTPFGWLNWIGEKLSLKKVVKED